MTSQHQNCRFYENKYPEVDDVVMVEVRVTHICFDRLYAAEVHVCVACAGSIDSGNGCLRTIARV